MALDWSDFTTQDIEERLRREKDYKEVNRVAELLEEAEGAQFPAQITDEATWANYCDEELYLLDKKVREYLKSMQWYSKSNNGFRTTAGLVFAWIFGRTPTAKDGAVCRKLNRLLNYYCTKVIGVTTINGKRVEKAYKFSSQGGQFKRPLSIKLRMEVNEEKTGQQTNRATFIRLKSEAPKSVTKQRTGNYPSGHREGDAGRADREDGGDEAR